MSFNDGTISISVGSINPVKKCAVSEEEKCGANMQNESQAEKSGE